MAVAALKPRNRASRSGSLLPDTVVREVGQQKLLATRICDLNTRPKESWRSASTQVIGELQRKGITFVPAYYLGDDDFWTADRAVSVNIPWYLANPELWRLVNDHLFEYTREEVLMYLRHEAGHAINYAFELWRRRDWTQTFGDFRRPYRDVYNPQPWSRDYVRYLHRAGMYHYAQKHPDEDWAETFAVWLEGGPWRRRYRDWQVALAKLEYVDRIVGIERACRGNPGNVRLGMRVPYTEIKETVADYFDINDNLDQDLLEYRSDLLEIFPRRPPRARAIAARGVAVAHRERAVGRALHPAAPEHHRRPHQALDRRQRQARDQPAPAPDAGALHRRAHGRSRQPPHREADRADRRRDLARRRRHPPPQLISPFPACAVWMRGPG